MNSVVGIDPGKHGGVALLHERGFVSAWPLDLSLLREDLAALRSLNHELVIWVEDVHAMPGQGVTSMFTFGYGAGMIYGLAQGLDIPIQRINPVRWKNRILGAVYPHDKSGTLAWAQAAYPTVSLIPHGCRVPHDGLVDALAIATYGWRMERNGE